MELLEVGQLVTLVRVEVGGILEQGPASVFDGARRLGAGKLANQGAADFVERVAGELRDVEAVENDVGLRGTFTHYREVTGGHVHGDVLDGARGRLADHVEELAQGVSTAANARRDDAAAGVIDDHGEVAVVFAVAELIDTDVAQAAQPSGIEALGDDPLHDRADRSPVDAHQVAHDGTRGGGGQVGDHLFEHAGKAAIGGRPGDMFDLDTAARALHSPRGVLQPEHHGAKGQMLPAAHRTTVVGGSRSLAAGTTWTPPARSYVDDQALGFETGAENEQ